MIREKTILLVEDEAVLALRQQKMLSAHGCRVVCAGDGYEAVDKAVKIRPDLILMDIDLGEGISGPEVAQQILEQMRVPIVFLTSHSDRESVERVRRITRYGYVLKNSGDFVLLSSIEMAFELFDAHSRLLEQDAQLQRAQKMARLGNWAINFKDQSVETSPEARRIYGIPHHSISVKDIQSVPLPEYRRMLNDALADLISSGEPYDVEFRIRRVDDGILRWIHSTAEYDEEQNRVIGTIQDVTEMKEAEAVARQAASRLAVTLDSIGDGVIAVDRQGRVERLNPVAQELTGWIPADAVGRQLEDIFHIRSAVSGKRVENPVAKVLLTGRIVGLANHTELVARDGTVRQIADSAAPIVEKDGTIQGVVLVFRDVTEEYFRQHELDAAAERFHRALDAIPLPVIIQTDDGVIRFLNRAWLEQTGYCREDLDTIDHWLALAYGNESSKIAERVQTLFDTESVVHEGVFPITASDGTKRQWDFYTAPLGSDNQGRRMIISVAHDLTELQQQQYENEFLARVLDQIQDLVTVTDLEGKITYVNEAECRQFQVDREQLIGRNITVYGGGTIDGMTQQELVEIAKQKGQWRGLIENNLPDNNKMILDTRINLITAPDGHTEALCGIATDVTGERVRQEQLRELLEEKDLLLREVHHRIKNDMAIIVELLSLQQLHLPKGVEYRSLDSAIGRVKTMMHLYEALYRKKVDTGTKPAQFLELLIEQLRELYKHRTNITLTATFQDGEMLSQRQLFPLGIMMNELITNCYKYAFPGQQAGEVQVGLHLQENGLFSLKVTDNGIGLSENREGCKESHFGMLLVGTFVRQLHGDWECCSKKGSTVEIRFPVEKGSA